MNKQKHGALGSLPKGGISGAALRLWERQGKINPARIASGHRVFTREDFDDIQKLRCSRLDKKESVTRDTVRVDISK